jgi:glycolate oxidase FAD binding subunit
MATASPARREEAPSTPEQAADVMRSLRKDGLTVRPVGGRTKIGWGNLVPEPAAELSTAKLDGVIEHNEGDYTIRVQAGVRVRDLQARVGEVGQMLSLDPPLGAGDAATVGGVISTGDSGPLRHRYGGPRDLVLGVTAVLSDGTVARAGGKVIKNVAGYDLSKLYTGAYGTLGLIAEVAVRLHPKPPGTATLSAESDDPRVIARAAAHLAHSTLEMDCLDVRWKGDSGAVLARFGGAAAAQAARGARSVLSQAGLEGTLVDDDDEFWERQRGAQRSSDGAVVKVSAVQTRIPDILEAAGRAGGSVVGRAAHGLCWVTLGAREPEKMVEAIAGLRMDLAPMPCVVLDAPADVRAKLDAWGMPESLAVELMRRVKPRFDPGGICNPGVYIGGI